MEYKETGLEPYLLLKRYLVSKNISQAEACRKADISTRYFSNIITGKAPITKKIAYKLEELFEGEVKASFWILNQALFDIENQERKQENLMLELE